jgi:DNA modification methylase
MQSKWLNQILCGDAQQILLRLQNQCIDLIFTSSPYANPQTLPTWFIRLFTKQQAIVLDPFIGSGTTAVAAVGPTIYRYRYFGRILPGCPPSTRK